MNDEATTKSLSEILTGARDRIADPKRFLRGTYAIDGRGHTVHPTDPDAVRWCSRGAIAAESGLPIAPHDAGTGPYRLLDRAAFDLFADKTYRINDINSHADVLRMFDRAIEFAQASEAPETVS